MSLESEAYEEIQKEEGYFDEAPDPEPIPTTRLTDFLPDLSILLSKTGPGSVDDYVDHPFNASESRGIARVLRGMTGLVGELDYAVVDITLGALEVIKEGRKSHEAVD